ncbi:MAG TPA: ABC transporter ATP-binding protein, partial [Ardenticatenaceae bacterium]|nr:ABC transporter ATP-binding protein [Ardenticatenaceae bacterium]
MKANERDLPLQIVSSIRVERLAKQFPGNAAPAVDHVSFEVEEGELIVLLGPSGCGKTTLLKMINRLYEPTAGAIFVDGKNVLDIPKTQLRRSMGYVIQQTGLFPHLSVEDNIATVPRLLGWEKSRTGRRVDELLDLVGLPLDFRRRYPRQLSGGEQQRVGIARALAADPGILLMDEPFGALDAITRGRLQAELLEIQARLAKTILFVTHDVDEALRLAGRIMVMRAGGIEQFARPLEILSQPANDFVAELVDAADVLRRLSLLQVADAVAPGVGRGTDATILATTSLRDALSSLLVSDLGALAVADGDGRTLGILTFEGVRRAV